MQIKLMKLPCSCSSIELILFVVVVVEDGGEEKWIGDDESLGKVKQSGFDLLLINGWRRNGERKWFRKALV